MDDQFDMDVDNPALENEPELGVVQAVVSHKQRKQKDYENVAVPPSFGECSELLSALAIINAHVEQISFEAVAITNSNLY
jgi:hypothetical protein